VIYTDTGVKATMPWFVLTLLGYDARLYSWQDWLANTPRLNISLKEVRAEPNPAKTGDVVRITAVFQEKVEQAKPYLDLARGEPMGEEKPAAEDVYALGNSSNTINSSNSSSSSNETILTIKGCATCGFGSPQGFADISSGTGIVQIGSKGKASDIASDNGFKCTARITSSSGADIGRVIMKRISGDEFSGIWNANVASGDYDVTIVASAGDITETFSNVLEIEVVGSSKYKNLG
jgi:thiosulfate/3-mercaptopyruvate sulfurtransferase